MFPGGKKYWSMKQSDWFIPILKGVWSLLNCEFLLATSRGLFPPPERTRISQAPPSLLFYSQETSPVSTSSLYLALLISAPSFFLRAIFYPFYVHIMQTNIHINMRWKFVYTLLKICWVKCYNGVSYIYYRVIVIF